MSMRIHCWLAGLALMLGGLMATLSHLVTTGAPADPALLEQYARSSQPLHLLLFAGGILVLLGWIGQYALQSSVSGVTGLITFLSIFLGILLGDLLHCALEFSILPILASSVPYALPPLVDTCYRLTPFAVLLRIGGFLIIAGVPATVFSLLRSHILPSWSAAPFAATAALLGIALVPRLALSFGPLSLAALYISMAVLGIAVMRSQAKSFRAFPEAKE
jgi:hypothetical protein